MLGYILIIWNVVVFLMYGYDKLMAIKDGWRVSEKTLLASAFLFGGIGAFFGMTTFRHKTKHVEFKVLVPICAIFTILVFLFFNRL